jgi:hypothetical protein
LRDELIPEAKRTASRSTASHSGWFRHVNYFGKKRSLARCLQLLPQPLV